MDCEEIRRLMMGYLDDELSEEERRRVDEHLESCAACALELSKFRRLEEVTGEMRFKEPSDEAWNNYWREVYNRMERGIGWIFTSLGAIVLLVYGSFRAIESFVKDPGVELAVKIGVLALIFGVVVLFVSVVRERIFTRRTDKYSKEVER